MSFRIPLNTSTLAALAICTASCRLFDPHAGGEGGGGLTVELEIRSAALAKSAAAPRPTDSVAIRVSGPGLETRIYGFGAGLQKFSLPDLTPGPSRRFEVSLMRQGRLLYAGEAETTLYADRKNSLFLHCLPSAALTRSPL